MVVESFEPESELDAVLVDVFIDAKLERKLVLAMFEHDAAGVVDGRVDDVGIAAKVDGFARYRQAAEENFGVEVGFLESFLRVKNHHSAVGAEEDDSV